MVMVVSGDKSQLLFWGMISVFDPRCVRGCVFVEPSGYLSNILFIVVDSGLVTQS